MNGWIKRIVAITLMVGMVLGLSVSASGEAMRYPFPETEKEKIESPSAMLMYVGVKQDQDVILYEKEADTPYQPGALMRVAMLGYAMKLIEQNDVDMDAVSGEYTLEQFNHYVAGTGLHVALMNFGERWTVRDLMTVCALQTAADCAVVLATVLAGSPEEFVAGLNGYAAELGCTGSHFTNVVCLNEDGQYMTARDVMTFTRAALEYAPLRKMLTLRQHTVTPLAGGKTRSWPTGNEMIRPVSDFYYTYATGGKTGGTLTETSVAEFGGKDGYEYLAVVMGAPRKNEKGDLLGTAYADARLLIRWGLLDFSYTMLARRQEPVGRIPVDNSSARDTIPLIPVKDLTTVINKAVDVTKLTRKILDAPERLTAPVAMGDPLGTLELYYEGKLIGTTPLVAGADAPYNFLYAVWQGVSNFFASPGFILFLIIALLLGVGYLFLNIRYNRKRRKKMHKTKK